MAEHILAVIAGLLNFWAFIKALCILHQHKILFTRREHFRLNAVSNIDFAYFLLVLSMICNLMFMYVLVTYYSENENCSPSDSTVRWIFNAGVGVFLLVSHRFKRIWLTQMSDELGITKKRNLCGGRDV